MLCIILGQLVHDIGKTYQSLVAIETLLDISSRQGFTVGN